MRMRNKDDKREVSRRALIKWGLAASAALGVSRSRLCEIFDRTAGSGIAYAAEDKTASFVIAIPMGNGGLANMNLLWPQVDIAEARNPQFSWHATGQESRVPGTDRPLVRGPDTPWESLAAKKQMTVFMAGANQTHVANADFNVGQNPLLPTLAAIQTTRASVIPFVGVGDISYGNAPGAPPITSADSPNGVVGLFNSAASRAGGLLEASSDAELYKTHYTAFAELNRAANRSTTVRPYNTAKDAARFLGTNLAALLEITSDDEARYGIDGDMQGNIAALGRGFIVAVKSFKLGLTSGIALPGLRDDPHGAFDGGEAPARAANLKKVFDGLMNDLNSSVDPNGKTLGDVTTIVVWGDTPKTPLDRNGWGDGTPQNSNWVYAYGAGFLKSGWFGGIDRTGNVSGFDPATGEPAPYNGGDTMRAAAAAIAFAVARGDMRRVQDFVNGVDINGLVNLQLI